jgi:hypothetical protein
MESPNADSLMKQYQAQGAQRPELLRLLRGFTGFQGAFRSASDKLEKAGQSS